MGEIVKVNTGYGADHFDARAAPHDHVVCTRCHKIQDLKMNYPENVEEIASMFYSGKIEGHTTNFYGICSECLAMESE